MNAPSPESGPPDHGEGLELFDFAKVRDYTGFVFRAVRRHPLVAAGAFLGVIGLTAGALAIIPRSYHVEAELLAQRQVMMAALGNPSRSIPGEADAPTRAAAETVRRRDNLVSLIKQTALLERFDASRAPLTKARDALVRLFTGPLTEEERLENLVELLEKRLYVFSSEGTVTIAIDWPEPQAAYQLVDTAQQNFLEARHASELSSIAESIAILERHASTVQESIDSAMDEVKRAKTQKPEAAGPRVAAPARPLPTPSNEGLTTEAQRLKGVLDAKRRAIRDLEDFRKKHLTELQAELVQQQQIYAPAHPNIVRLQQSIAAQGEDSPQLTALRREERDLTQEYYRLGGTPNDEKRDELKELRGAAVLPQAHRLLDGEGTAEQYAKSRLRFVIGEYESLMQRIDAARIELDTARAAFKYRYSVIKPAKLPKSPESPKVPKFLALGAMLAFLSAFGAAAFVDWRSGRIVERWQVERGLGVPYLGQIERS
jgi:uncharacterized protein involved in exopolysaccharide biosynthesis